MLFLFPLLLCLYQHLVSEAQFVMLHNTMPWWVLVVRDRIFSLRYFFVTANIFIEFVRIGIPRVQLYSSINSLCDYVLSLLAFHTFPLQAFLLSFTSHSKFDPLQPKPHPPKSWSKLYSRADMINLDLKQKSN